MKGLTQLGAWCWVLSSGLKKISFNLPWILILMNTHAHVTQAHAHTHPHRHTRAHLPVCLCTGVALSSCQEPSLLVLRVFQMYLFTTTMRGLFTHYRHGLPWPLIFLRCRKAISGVNFCFLTYGQKGEGREQAGRPWHCTFRAALIFWISFLK